MTLPAIPLPQLFKALADDLRLGILQVLGRDSYGVLELAQAFAVPQPNLSHHLKVLSAAGLTETRREGNSIFYRRSHRAAALPLVDALYRQLDRTPFPGEVAEGLAAVWRLRAERSQQFFLENAARFERQQDLICAHEVYAGDSLALTDAAARDFALEVGPGAGELLPYLSRRFAKVVALDNSAEMLRRARAHCQGAQAGNVAFVHGDTSALADYPGVFSCAVLNMVLHHVASPAQVVTEVAASLAAGGVLVISELCAHEQAWAREACGDVWLGFAPEELTAFAQAAGLDAAGSSYLALRNGFQVQLQQFIHP